MLYPAPMPPSVLGMYAFPHADSFSGRQADSLSNPHHQSTRPATPPPTPPQPVASSSAPIPVASPDAPIAPSLVLPPKRKHRSCKYKFSKQTINQLKNRPNLLLTQHGPRRVYPFKTDEQIQAMQMYLLSKVKSATTPTFKAVHLRNWLYFSLGINMGYRGGDLTSMRWSDILNPDYTVKNGAYNYIIEEKTKKRRQLVVNSECQRILAFYFSYTGIRPPLNEYIFPSKVGGHITVNSMGQVLKAAAKAVGIPFNVNTHSLRKTFGYRYYKATGDLATLQHLFNHTSPLTTLIYIGIDNELVVNAYEQVTGGTMAIAQVEDYLTDGKGLNKSDRKGLDKANRKELDEGNQPAQTLYETAQTAVMQTKQMALGDMSLSVPDAPDAPSMQDNMQDNTQDKAPTATRIESLSTTQGGRHSTETGIILPFAPRVKKESTPIAWRTTSASDEGWPNGDGEGWHNELSWDELESWQDLESWEDEDSESKDNNVTASDSTLDNNTKQDKRLYMGQATEVGVNHTKLPKPPSLSTPSSPSSLMSPSGDTTEWYEEDSAAEYHEDTGSAEYHEDTGSAEYHEDNKNDVIVPAPDEPQYQNFSKMFQKLVKRLSIPEPIEPDNGESDPVAPAICTSQDELPPDDFDA